MSDEAREIHPFTMVAPDVESPVKDFRPRFEEPDGDTVGDDEEFGGLTVEDVTPDGAGEGGPKGDTATGSASSSNETSSSPKVPAPKPTVKSANVDTEGSASKPDKV